MNIIVDNREHTLIHLLKELNEQFEIRQLDIGDFIVNDIIIERKTIKDLASSIKDGRYREQKARMMSSGSPIAYIFEGAAVQTTVNGIACKTLQQAILNCILRDKIYTFRTCDSRETLNLLLMISKSKHEPCSNKEITYSPIHVVKRNNMTAEMVYLSQLSCIPGISLEIAKKIANRWPNMCVLCSAHNDEENLKKRKRLTSSVEGIGAILSERIYNMLSDDSI